MLLIFFLSLILGLMTNYPVHALKEPPSPNYEAFVNTEDGQYVTVFNKKGLNWNTCTKTVDPITKEDICSEAVAWLARDVTKITVIGDPETAMVKDPITGEMQEETYIKVRVLYSRRGKNGWELNTSEGYVEKYNLSLTPSKTFFGVSKKNDTTLPGNPDKECPPTVLLPELKDVESESEQLKEAVQNLGVKKSAEVLSKVVGFCAAKPPTSFPRNLNPKMNPYDQLVYSALNKIKAPKLLREDGKRMTHEDMVNVDAMARTLYGEMAQCFRYGLQYPMAVAKVISQRAKQAAVNEVRKKLFVRPPHDESKPMLTKVTTSMSQFSMWKRTKLVNGAHVDNDPLHHGLCPPQQLGKPFYHNSKASKFENDIWVNTMRIATEAVLFPKKFEARTANVKAVYYTSNLSKYKEEDLEDIPKSVQFIKSLTQVHPAIEGHKIDNNNCLEIWSEK